jgi:GNAT superfamily N-acetyltransferase
MEIRQASAGDASAACAVIRRSIVELCTLDHKGDAAVLASWLANKTTENVGSWIANENGAVLVAVEHGVILGVAAATNAGEITLNYISPDARFRGVSRALLGALESRIRERGNPRCTLSSTATALRFYVANGYAEDEVPATKFGIPSYRMSKALDR